MFVANKTNTDEFHPRNYIRILNFLYIYNGLVMARGLIIVRYYRYYLEIYEIRREIINRKETDAQYIENTCPREGFNWPSKCFKKIKQKHTRERIYCERCERQTIKIFELQISLQKQHKICLLWQKNLCTLFLTITFRFCGAAYRKFAIAFFPH